MRFLTEQYAEQLPVGCMLGYVLDGDVPFANSRIADAIGSHVPLALAEGPTPLAAIETIERFRTRHTAKPDHRSNFATRYFRSRQRSRQTLEEDVLRASRFLKLQRALQLIGEV